MSYGLDPVGSRSSESSSLPDIPSGSFTFNADDELSSESYDPNGNVTASGAKTFTYDSQNQMQSMAASGTSVSMVYDAFGNRVGKSANGVVIRYLVDDLNPTGYPQVMEELNGAGTVTRTYTYGLQRIDEEQVLNGAWTPSFYGYDGGGSVRQLTNTTGAITDSYEYDAFGNSFTVSGTTPNNYLYRGEQFDSDLGLYYLRARYYNPITGRFMSRDPEDGYIGLPITSHKYLYVGGDPINHFDPHGRFLAEYAGENSEAIPEAKLVSIYGCVADAGLAAIDLILEPSIDLSTELGVGSTVIGCVLLTPEVAELAQQENVIVERADFLSKALAWGACATNADDFIHAIDDIALEKPNKNHKVGNDIGGSLAALEGCVVDALGQMLVKE